MTSPPPTPWLHFGFTIQFFVHRSALLCMKASMVAAQWGAGLGWWLTSVVDGGSKRLQRELSISGGGYPHLSGCILFTRLTHDKMIDRCHELVINKEGKSMEGKLYFIVGLRAVATSNRSCRIPQLLGACMDYLAEEHNYLSDQELTMEILLVDRYHRYSFWLV